MIREPYNLNPYNSTIDTSKVNNFSFTFSGDELGSWNIEIAKNNTSPEIVYTSEEFVPEDVGYTHIYDGDIVEGTTLPSTIAHSQGDDGLLRRLYSINGYPFNAAVVKLNVNGIENIGNIKGSIANGYLVATNYSLGRTGSNVTIIGFDRDGTTIGSQVTDGTYDFLGYLLSVKENSNIEIGQVVQIGGNSFVIGSIEDAGDGYSELTIVNGEATSSDVTPILTFDSLAEADVTELSVDIEPVQDLNGYDKPWVGGAGKNLFNATVDGYKAENTNGTWSGNTYTINGVSFALNTDDGGNVISITVNGTSSNSNARIYCPNTSLPANTTFTLHGVPRGYGGTNLALYLGDATAAIGVNPSTGNGSPTTFTTVTAGNVRPAINVNPNVTITNAVCYPQLELGSTATSYEPYSNICPITGHDSVSVYSTGKNLNPWQGVNYSASVSRTIWLNEGTYILSTDNGNYLGGNNAIYFAHYDANGNNITDGAISSTQLTLNGGKTFYYGSLRSSYVFTILKEGLYSFGFNNEVPSNVGALQLELGSTATAYEPYQGSTYTTSLGQTVYGGTLDMVSGVLTRRVGVVRLDGTLTYRNPDSAGTCYIEKHDMKRMTNYADSILCDSLKARESRFMSNYAYGISGYEGPPAAFPGQNWLYFKVDDIATATEIKEFFTNNPVYAYYPLATPVEYQLTPQQIKTLVGTNNVWASSGQIVNIKFTYETN